MPEDTRPGWHGRARVGGPARGILAKSTWVKPFGVMVGRAIGAPGEGSSGGLRHGIVPDPGGTSTSAAISGRWAGLPSRNWRAGTMFSEALKRERAGKAGF